MEGWRLHVLDGGWDIGVLDVGELVMGVLSMWFGFLMMTVSNREILHNFSDKEVITEDIIVYYVYIFKLNILLCGI